MKKGVKNKSVKKKSIKKEIIAHITLIIITISIIASIYFLIGPSFIGYTVLEGNSWSAENSSNFNYDENEIEILDSKIKLKQNISSSNWTTYSQEIFQISKAYFDPDDKTSKVIEQENTTQEINASKMTSFIFDSYLNNGDVINLYLKNEESTNIYLCNPYNECTSTNLGQLSFQDVTGDYQITIQNLNSQSNIFNLNSDGKIKLDFINSTNSNITNFWYEHEDKLSKLNANDNNTLAANDNEILDLVFSQELQDNDVIQLFLKQEGTTNIYLCNPEEECTSTNLGQFNFPNQAGFYNLTVQNLNPQSKSFNLNSDEEIEIDFIEAIRVTETNNSETNITYPETANVTTQEFMPENLELWDLLVVEEILNNQNISYEYSIDSGSNWAAVPESKNLSEINSTKIMIKAILSSNTTATPELSLINITYIKKDNFQEYYDVNETSELTISTRENTNTIINSSNAKIELNLLPSASLSNVEFNISHPSENHTSQLSRLKELEIISPELNNNLHNATIKIYYTDDEVAGMDESTLKVYYFNETTQLWQEINSTTNIEQNFIEADLEHFSIYGIFGEDNSQSSGSSSSSGGSGGKQTFIRGESEPPAQPQQVQQAEKIETAEEIIPVQTQESEQQETLAGNAVKVLTSGKVNQSLIILAVILIAAYIVVRLNERK